MQEELCKCGHRLEDHEERYVEGRDFSWEYDCLKCRCVTTF